MAKPDKDFICTPVDDLGGNPKNLKPGGGDWNGEPGYPSRTDSSNAVPEKTHESWKSSEKGD